MNLPEEFRETLPNYLFKPVATSCQEAQTEDGAQEIITNDTSVQVGNPMSNVSTQFLISTTDAWSQAVHELIDTSTQFTTSLANTSAQAGTGFPTIESSAQTQAILTSDTSVQNIVTTSEISMQTETSIPNPEIVQEKCQLLQKTIEILRTELTSIKESLNSPDTAIFTQVVQAVQDLRAQQAIEMSALKKQYSRDLDLQNQTQLQLTSDLEELKKEKEEIAKAKVEEILTLKIKISQVGFLNNVSLK